MAEPKWLDEYETPKETGHWLEKRNSAVYMNGRLDACYRHLSNERDLRTASKFSRWFGPIPSIPCEHVAKEIADMLNKRDANG